MQGFIVDKVKSLNASLYILNQLGEADYHRVFKILYFADQEHLKNFGRPITGDSYQAMQYGPVPSFIYDLFKAAEKGSHPFAEGVEMSTSFSVRRDNSIPYVKANRKSMLDELAETELEVITRSIASNRELNFTELVEKSHDAAWQNAAEKQDIEMSVIDIAQAAGTSDEMINYIALNAENDLGVK